MLYTGVNIRHLADLITSMQGSPVVGILMLEGFPNYLEACLWTIPAFLLCGRAGSGEPKGYGCALGGAPWNVPHKMVIC